MLYADGGDVNVEAEEAKKALWGAIKKQKKKGAAAAAAAGPAPVIAAPTWRERLAARNTGQVLRGGSVDTGNTFMFPSLAHGVSGLAAGARMAEGA
jgi:hypothetical protein